MKLHKLIRYQNIISFAIGTVLAYILFVTTPLGEYISGLGAIGYLGIFFAGFLYSFGFSAPIATGMLLVTNPENILLASCIAGLGSVVSDVLLFRFAKKSLKKEINEIEKIKTINKIEKKLTNCFSRRIKKQIMYLLAILFIASPLPDEIGITFLASVTKITEKYIATISFVSHTLFLIALLIFSSI